MAKQIVDVLDDIPETGASVALPTEYVGSIVNEYLAALKAAEKVEELKPGLIALGLEAVVAHNCKNPPEKWVKSAKLVGKAVNDEEPFVTAIAVDKDPKLDSDLVSKIFATVTTAEGKVPNPNNYTRYQVVAEFDSSCFHDKKGNIDPERTNEILEEFDALARKLQIKMPITISKQLVVTRTWWEERFTRFVPAVLHKLFKAIPQQVQIRLPKEKKVTA